MSRRGPQARRALSTRRIRDVGEAAVPLDLDARAEAPTELEVCGRIGEIDGEQRARDARDAPIDLDVRHEGIPDREIVDLRRVGQGVGELQAADAIAAGSDHGDRVVDVDRERARSRQVDQSQ